MSLVFFDEKHPVQALCKDVIIMADKLKDKARTLTSRPVPHYIMGHSDGVIHCANGTDPSQYTL